MFFINNSRLISGSRGWGVLVKAIVDNTNIKRKNKKLERRMQSIEHGMHKKNRKQIIDLDLVERFADIGCSHDEIASIMGCSSSYFQAQVDKNPQLAALVERGYNTLKGKLRRAQIDMALSGNPALLIWLGKQWLGQKDKQETTTTTHVNILVQSALTELNNIPKQQLLAARDMLRGGQVITEPEIIENEGGGGPPV